ncbi:hypothetical protein [Variovorax sp. GB1P17]|uniref:hypothetical protein n=1 Tax=Variovorax sp. GB1P17 TaxID=3443740 RepID=UPI003F46E17C
MTLFELVKIALDTLYKESVAVHGAQTDAIIKQQFDYLSSSYGLLTDQKRVPISYRDPATRFAYVYRYVATHGDYLVQLLTLLRSHAGKVFQTESARLTCIGGGPGSDVIAVLKYLSDHAASEPVKKLVVYLLDKEQAWADTWTELDDKLQASVALNANFQPLDVTDPASWSAQKRFLEADVFTLSYFVSEVYALDKNGVVTNFWQTLFREAKPGALFFYDDNGHGDFNDYFDAQWQKAGCIDLVGSATNVTFTPSYTERADVLDDYKERFAAWPKLRGQLSWRILKKR